MGCAPGSDYCNTTITFDPATNHINSSGYTYDAAGNQLKDDAGCNYAWDAEGRLTSVSGCATLNFTYNALGQRVEKKVGTSTYTEIAYDAAGNAIGFHDRTSWTQQFVPFGATPLAKFQGSATRFLHGNHLGSTTFVTDASGAVMQKTLYYPWGQRWASTATVVDERFAALGLRDPETGEDPTLFRTYHPRLYRWLSPDPLAGEISNPQSLNRYSYVLNNPTNLIDALGLQGDDEGPPEYIIRVMVWGPYLGVLFGNGPGRFAPLLDQTAPGVGGREPPGPAWLEPPRPPWNLVAPVCSDVFRLEREGGIQIAHPFLEERVDENGLVSYHQGADFRAAQGTLLMSNTDATVVFSGRAGTWGNLLVLQTEYGQFGFAHMQSLPGFVPGQSVPAGFPLGTTGTTGRSDAPHLHGERHTPGTMLLEPGIGRNPVNVVTPCIW